MSAATTTNGEYDLVIIGGGIAGWTAARRMQSLGRTAALIERGSEGHGASGTRLSGGRFHAAYHNPRTRTPDELYARLLKKTANTARPELARAWAENTGRAMEFLVSQGAELHAVGPEEYLQTALKDGPQIAPGPRQRGAWKDRGPDRLLTRLSQSFVADGGTFMKGVRAVALETKNGAVVGVHAERADGSRELVRGRAVLIADGGFGANQELMVEYGVSKRPYQYGCSEYSRGDGLKMAVAIGAKTHGLDSFYGSLAVRDAVAAERLRGTPLNLFIDASIVVNGNGVRIGDEAFGTEDYSLIDWPLDNAVAKTDAPGDSWVVVDDAVWQAAVEEDTDIKHHTTAMPSPDQLRAEQARIRARAEEIRAASRTRDAGSAVASGGYVSATTLPKLATLMRVPAEALTRTVETFNRFVSGGGAIDPPRGGRPEPVSKGPFHAVAIVPSVLFTEGGILINGDAQVLDQKERPIPGLYAAGNAAGGLQGGPHNGYAGGLCTASTFGMLAAEHATSRVGVAAGR